MASCKGGICHLGLWSQWLLSTKQEPFCEQFGRQGVEARGESCSKQHCSGHNSLSLGSSASVSTRQQGLIHWAGKALLRTFWYVSWNQCPSLPQTTSKLFLGKVPLYFCPSDEKSHPSEWLSYVGSEFCYRCSWNSEQVSEYLGATITLSIWDTPLPSLGGVCEGRQSLMGEEGQQEQSWDTEAGQRTPPHFCLLFRVALRRCYTRMRSNRETFSWIATVIKIIKNFFPV